MKRTSRLSLARRLLADAERSDLTEQARAALVVAACLVAEGVIHDESTPVQHIRPLARAVLDAAAGLSREVH